MSKSSNAAGTAQLPQIVPVRSHRLYLELAASEVAMFRFLLEAYDNLAYFTVVDRRRAVLKVVYAPGARRELDRALHAMGQEIEIRVLPDITSA